MSKSILKQDITRDKNLDIYRGWVMIYIVTFIHTIHPFIAWGSNVFITLLLLEMPVIFYISGAAFSLSKHKPYSKYVKSKIKRIIIPLAIFIFFVTLYKAFYGIIAFQLVIPHTVKELLTALVLGDVAYEVHLWFIQPYLIIALLLPLLYKFTLRANKAIFYTSLIVYMAVLNFFPNHSLCYLAPTVAGLYYKRPKPFNIYIVCAIMILGMIVCMLQGYEWNMQENKFSPANLMFLSYTSTALILLHKPLSYTSIKLAQLPIIKFFVTGFARYDFSIYLYHLFIFGKILDIYNNRIVPNIPVLDNPICSFLIISTAMLCIMPFVGMVTDYINKKVTIAISFVWHSTRNLFIKRDKTQ